MKKIVASLALRYVEIRRECEAINSAPYSSKEQRHEARQDLADARESLAHAIGEMNHEEGMQVLFLATGNIHR